MKYFSKSWNGSVYFGLRASYGVTGGQNFNPYQAMTTYRFITDKWYGYGSGAEMLALGNDDLKWQSTVQKISDWTWGCGKIG